MNLKTSIKIKNIAGRIPETNRSGNPFKRHPTTHQTKRAFTMLYSINVSWVNCVAIGIIQIESGNCVANGECVIYFLSITWRLGNRVANG